MKRRFSKSHRDDNEPQILEFLKQAGVPFIQLREGDGADLLVLLTPMQFWEVKNPEQDPNKRRLTEAERQRMAYCHEHDIPYHVIETVDEALVAVNHSRGG